MDSAERKRRPINLRKRPKRLWIPPSTEWQVVIITPEKKRARVWADVPALTEFEAIDVEKKKDPVE